MTTLREAAQAALRIIELRRNLGNAEYDKQAEQAANDLRAVLAVESVRSALAEFDASLTDPALASVHQTAEPAQPVAWKITTQTRAVIYEDKDPAKNYSEEWLKSCKIESLYAAPPALAFPARLTDEDFGVFWLASTSDVDVSKSFAALALHYGRAVEAEVLRRMGVVE